MGEHFDVPMEVEALAEMVHMGVSAFHAHFKAVTSIPPLQYQKLLRLQAARHLLATSAMDAICVGTSNVEHVDDYTTPAEMMGYQVSQAEATVKQAVTAA